MYFDIHRSDTTYSQQYWWVAKGNNNETLCHSEMLASKQACINAIRVIKNDADIATVYDETGETHGDIDARKLRV